MAQLTSAEVWAILAEIADPEIPVISLVELGIVRQVQVEAGKVTVLLAPTFTACPALESIRSEVCQRLLLAGAAQAEALFTHAPPWTSDWITPAGRDQLKAFGLAPPGPAGLISLEQLQAVTCAYCGSQDTVLKNSFGSTPCRAIFYCNRCLQPFEQFKPI
jgi:ring-1,2-phenylacetyl-CoA epoxidase subunit PaaD